MLHHILYVALTLIASAACGDIKVTLWNSPDCGGDNDLLPQADMNLMRGCIKRGDVAQQLALENHEDQREELALSAYFDGSLKAQSQVIALFTSENCDPSTLIEDAYVDNSCSNVFPALSGDKWKSWEMRDACVGGFSGCDMDGPIIEL